MSEDSVSIRNAHLSDIPAIQVFMQPFVESEFVLPRSDKDMAVLVRHGFVATIGDDIVGFAALEIYSRKLNFRSVEPALTKGRQRKCFPGKIDLGQHRLRFRDNTHRNLNGIDKCLPQDRARHKKHGVGHIADINGDDTFACEEQPDCRRRKWRKYRPEITKHGLAISR